MPDQEGTAVFDSPTVSQAGKFIDDVLFVMTLYRRSLGDSPAWISLEAALSPFKRKGQLFIYDNNPLAQNPPSSSHLRAAYRHNTNNPGISAAYNSAYQYAKSIGKKCLLFLDQDTRIDARAIAEYAVAIRANPGQSLFVPVVKDVRGVLSPFLFKHGAGVRVDRFPTRILGLREFRAINAGMLASCELFGSIGGYEESIALDFSDIAFQEKAHRAGYSLCMVDATLRQEFSGSSPTELADLLERFKKFNCGARQYSHQFGGATILKFRTLLRAVKLSARWGTLGFLGIHFKIWSA